MAKVVLFGYQGFHTPKVMKLIVCRFRIPMLARPASEVNLALVRARVKQFLLILLGFDRKTVYNIS